jgi:hypothetical protein
MGMGVMVVNAAAGIFAEQGAGISRAGSAAHIASKETSSSAHGAWMALAVCSARASTPTCCLASMWRTHKQVQRYHLQAFAADHELAIVCKSGKQRHSAPRQMPVNHCEAAHSIPEK